MYDPTTPESFHADGYHRYRHRAGDRVRMPNGVLATVCAAEGRLAEGALAEGDDGATYFVAECEDDRCNAGIRACGARPVIPMKSGQ